MSDEKKFFEENAETSFDYKKMLSKKWFSLFNIRMFDIFASAIGLLLLSPLFLFVAIAIKLTSKGEVFFKQTRVGKNEKQFKILKFRTMVKNAESKGLQLSTSNDMRITSVGKFLRKAKIDELPQLINVLIGDMSLVGPRPEVPKYVDLYDAEQKNVLLVRPGITDMASIKFRNENEILENSDDAEKSYIEEIMPVKLALNLKYIQQMRLCYNIKLIFETLFVVLTE